MSNFSALKTAIQNAIKQNGNEEITGNLLQNILLSIVETLGDSAINTLETDLSNEADTRSNDDTQLNNLITGIKNNIDNGYVYAGIATPSTNPVSGKVFYVAIQAGIYTSFGNLQVQNGISILLVENGSWTLSQLLVIDFSLVQNSKNPVSGGAVYQAIQHENSRAVDAENALHQDIVAETDKRRQEIQGMRDDVLDLIHEYRPIEIEGNVVNAPDEEDITQQPNNLLKFKDKDYNPTIFSGLGRKYLRKNIIVNEDYTSFDGFEMNPEADAVLEGQPDSIFWDRLRERFIAEKEGVYYLNWQGSGDYIPVSADKIYVNENIPYFWNGEDLAVDDDVIARYGNILTQEMMSDANTIYVIQYDFTLGENITVPANCVLEFDGGSINNGTLILNDTAISAPSKKIFNNVNISGIYTKTIIADWFENLNACIDSLGTVGYTIQLSNKTYIVDKTIVLPNCSTLIGFKKLEWSDSDCTVIKVSNAFVGDSIIQLGLDNETNRNYKLQDFNVVGNSNISGIYFSNNVYSIQCTNIYAKSCANGFYMKTIWAASFDFCKGYTCNNCFLLKDGTTTSGLVFKDCVAAGSSGIGISIAETSSEILLWNYNVDAAQTAIEITKDCRVTLINSVFEQFSVRALLIDHPNVNMTLINCTIGANSVNSNHIVDIKRAESVTFINCSAASSIAPSDPNYKIINIDPSCYKKVRFIGCLFDRNTSPSISNTFILNNDNTIFDKGLRKNVPLTITYAYGQDTQTKVLDSTVVFLNPDGSDRYLKGTPIFNYKGVDGELVQLININSQYNIQLAPEGQYYGETGNLGSEITLQPNESVIVRFTGGKFMPLTIK